MMKMANKDPLFPTGIIIIIIIATYLLLLNVTSCYYYDYPIVIFTIFV